MNTVPEARHPLLVGGDEEAGFVFAAMLHDVVRNAKHRENRGFPEAILTKIAAGRHPVAPDAIRQLITDFFVAYPKRVAQGAPEYYLLKSVVNGVSSVPQQQVRQSVAPVPIPKPKPVSNDVLVSLHGARIVLLCDACGVSLASARRAIFLGETRTTHVTNEIVSAVAKQLRLPQTVLLGQWNFDRRLTPVAKGASWQGPLGPFVPGDKRASYMWASLLSSYTAIKRWFRAEYGLSDELIGRIEASELGVPIPVHLVLMGKVKERLASINNPDVPFAYPRLQKLEETIPAKLLSPSSTATPCKEWFLNLQSNSTGR